jgi:predicted nuclease of predicted toxin-antitoxin system
VRFLADACIDVRVAKWLRDIGHDAIHLRDEGLQRLPNGRIFEKAHLEKRVVLTFDLDFSEIAALSNFERTSVIVFRLRNTRTHHVIERLSAVLDESMAALKRGAVVTVEESRFRVRYVPIGKTKGRR